MFSKPRQEFSRGGIDRRGERSIVVVKPFVEPVLSEYVGARDDTL